MDFIKGNDKRLFQVAEKFDFSNPPVDPYELQKDMLRLMNRDNQISVNANQFGLPYHIFCLAGSPNLVFFNAEVVYGGDYIVSLEETCYNIPKGIVKVKRPDEVRIRYQTASGGKESKTFKGLTSRLIQHNLDYLNGIRFFDRSNLYHKEKMKKIIRNL